MSNQHGVQFTQRPFGQCSGQYGGGPSGRQARPGQAFSGRLIVVAAISLYVWFVFLPLFIYWRCGAILRRLERLERQIGTESPR